MIYLLEDDENIRKLVLYTFNSQGMEAMGFMKPSEFWAQMKRQLPDIILLDIMLPEEDGLSILKKLREEGKTENIPVIMLTAKGSEYDKVIGLNEGADDYISKPFSMLELVARVNARLRRIEKNSKVKEYKLEELYVCPAKHLVKVAGEKIVLTFKEYEMLCLLLANEGMVLSRNQLLEKIWGYEYEGETRTVDVHIRTLRKKLGVAGEYIHTVKGVGYKIGGDN
ncbi:MAG: response regulator transcription factor [Lachnospiraceae bacterium]|nr:response regulator transcription factor [Lachnospiraceae bacterium]